MNFDKVDLAHATIIDVRSEMEFERGHILGAVNIPLEEIEERIDDFKSFDGDVVLCCLSGNRSGTASKFLNDLGVNNVCNGGGWGILNLQVLNAKAAMGICDST